MRYERGGRSAVTRRKPIADGIAIDGCDIQVIRKNTMQRSDDRMRTQDMSLERAVSKPVALLACIR